MCIKCLVQRALTRCRLLSLSLASQIWKLCPGAAGVLRDLQFTKSGGPRQGEGNPGCSEHHHALSKGSRGCWGGRRAGEEVGVTADPWACSKPRVSCGPTRLPGHLCKAGPPRAAVQRAAAEGWGRHSEGATGWWARLCVSLPWALLSLALFSIPTCTQALTIQPPCRHPSQRDPSLRGHLPGLP